MNGMNRANELLQSWLYRRLDDAVQLWMTNQINQVASSQDNRTLYTAFALVGRKLGKGVLDLTPEEIRIANDTLPGWMPGAWSQADAGRILLLASLPAGSSDFVTRFVALCQTAEVAEAVSLYRGLPLYPEPERLEPQVGEGLRSNMRSVFEAIAHHNPYPMQIFSEHRWNHMVLKAIFIGSPLAPILGLDERANPELARIMFDFVHERRAAGREVPFEIWRCAGPFAKGGDLADLEWVLATGDERARKAAALALAANPEPDAATLLRQASDLSEEIDAGRLSWAMLQ